MGSLLRAGLILAISGSGWIQAADESASDSTPTFRQYCFPCHGKAAVAGLNLEQLAAHPSVGENFRHWENVAAALEAKRMPPEKMPQPSETERRHAVAYIRAKLDEFMQKHAGDPGRVTVRRLTSGEYTYTIEDLTGLELKFDRDFATDSVGGEGFTNFGDVQFMQDANLERYLEAAKRVAGHAVIGSGPITFFEHTGKSGMELSALSRIQEIYRANGFRNVAGEGARAYGLDHYGKAFLAAWRYKNRASFGESKLTLDQIAAREGVSARFAHHIWTLLNQPSPTYPISDVIARWRRLPAPKGPDTKSALAAARAGSEDLQKVVVDWPRFLFGAGPLESLVGDDPVYLLTEETLNVPAKQNLRFLIRGRGIKTVRLYLRVSSMNPSGVDKPGVTWRQGAIRVLRGPTGGERRIPTPSRPLKALLDESTVQKLGFGKDLDGKPIDPNDFVMAPDTVQAFDLTLPEGAPGVEVQFVAQIPEGSGDAILRCTISDKEKVSEGRTTPVLLGNAGSPGHRLWKAGVLEFAGRLPQNSHGEPTPSDRDPIPPPFNTAYNQPERDRFHTKIKYYRTDRFLVENMLDDATRAKLDQAWSDLRSSFDYHTENLRFIVDKYKLDLKGKGISDLSRADVQSLPAEPRTYVNALLADYLAVQEAQKAAQAGHVQDSLQFAAKAWRRPLSKAETLKLRSFYEKALAEAQQDHSRAIRSLLARVLVAPAFLYRLELPSQASADRPLSDWEMASRLSYFLWSSIPDDDLRRAASAGELKNPEKLQAQVKRMLADPKARRLSTEFFGQWLGFYRFDQYRGVDTTRFPEFTDEVKSAMYDEAVTFFEHIVRKDRPVREILSADYTFLNQALAKHYGIGKEIKSTTEPELVDKANAFERGGVLRLGAVLTVTSAPLRTSPVKRGDWVLRRILGTPTPPPPPDAGSIPADEKAFGGMTVFDRLEAHKRNPTCASCHTRIDPLGFPLESYDAVGRWRNTYSDGKPVHNSAVAADRTPIAGVDGLLQYLNVQEKQVLRTLTSKLLGYALGRTVLASDQPLIRRLSADGGNATFAKLATEIVTSRQFRNRREIDDGQPANVKQANSSVGSKDTVASNR